MTQQLTPEELVEIRKVRDEYVRITSEIGQYNVEQLNLELRLEEIALSLEELRKQYKETKQKDIQVNTKLQSKYGICTIDLDSGEITKN